ncbi:MAG: CHASE2 domain-containing protein, partial [Proteobacteria bacterium]
QDFSARIKILALDDSTFSYLGGPRLSYEQMDALLKNIAARKPKAILIDGLLAETPYAIPEKVGAKVDIPVYSGSFVAPEKVNYRLETNLEGAAYQTSTYLSNGLKIDQVNYTLDRLDNWFVYGHSRSYDALIKASGHIIFNKDTTISPFFRLNDKTLVPHLSLFAADTIHMDEDHLRINDHVVPLTRDGRVMVNHRNADYFSKRATPLRYPIQRALNGEEEIKIDEGDVVIILFAFATGNTDFHEGPFGDMPGGVIIASMVSDVLDGTWMSKWEWDSLLIMIFGVLGIMVGINLSIRSYLAVLICTWIVYSAAVIALFVYGSIWCPWALPMVAFSGTSLIHFVHVRIYKEMKLMLIERNFQMEKAKRLERNKPRRRVS